MSNVIPVLEFISDSFGYILIGVLSFIGLMFCFRTKFVQFRMFKEACRVTFFHKESDSSKQKHVSSFQTFCISLGTRVGVGNIIGVSLALLVGGPGAIFWMWVFALIGAATACIESTLGQIFKEKTSDGTFVGGPAYNAKYGLGKPKLGVVLALIAIICYGFCISATFFHTITTSVSYAHNIPVWIVALFLVIITGLVIFTGFRGIAKISAWLVSIMAIAYLLLALITICTHIEAVPDVFARIFTGAFDISAGLGGLLGSTILVGVQRGLFSNEAGDGSIPMLTSSTHPSHPVKQGLTQSIGVFVDTLVICTATAFMIMVFGDFSTIGADSSTLLPTVLSTGFLGDAAPYVVSGFMVIFAFTSILGTCSMGEINLKYFSSKKSHLTILRILILAFLFVTSLLSFDTVWAINDIAIAIHTILNCIILFILGRYALEALKDYQKQKKKGVKEPVFHPDCLSDQNGVTSWKK